MTKDFDIDFAHENRGLAKSTLEGFRFPHPDRVQNFNPGAKTRSGKKAGQRFPYPWEAHHMLPGSAFYYEDASGHCFEPWQIQLILQGDYNINHGHNMIPLPDLSRDVPIHKLIQHPGDHPVYTQLVMTKLRAIADAMEQMKSQGTPHPDLKAKIFDLRTPVAGRGQSVEVSRQAGPDGRQRRSDRPAGQEALGGLRNGERCLQV